MALTRERPEAAAANQKDQEKVRCGVSSSISSSLLALMPKTTTATPTTRTDGKRQVVGVCALSLSFRDGRLITVLALALYRHDAASPVVRHNEVHALARPLAGQTNAH
nr:hypothetical protein BaRGS_006779 [Batillaria attramentaria]